MNNKIINSKSLKSFDWSVEYFQYFEFSEFEIEGLHIDSDFSECTFRNIEFYWGIFNIINFINCKFENCTFRGTAFPNCKFIDCQLTNCSFEKDNLNGDCDFTDSKAYNCTTNNCRGFNAEIYAT
jgi:uncharacterized protein YjbI with pentapeptide repeats